MAKENPKKYKPSNEESDEIQKLKEENYWLRMENDIIKKKIELRERKREEIKKRLESFKNYEKNTR